MKDEPGVGLSRLKSPNWYLPILMLVLLIGNPLVLDSTTYIQVSILVLWYACLTASWNFVGGFAGVLPLGHAAFAGIGAYTSTLLFMNWGITPWIGMLVGGVLAVLAALVIGIPTFKLHGAYYALSSIAVVEIIRIITENTQSIFGIQVNGTQGLLVPLKGHAPLYFQFGEKIYFYYIILAILILIVTIAYKINNSKLGYYLVAGGEDQEAAESLGINVTRCKLIALSLSAFFTAIAGTFYAQLVLYIFPQGIMALNLSFEIAFIAIIGGRGTLLGPVIGAMILVPIGEISRIYLSGSRFLGIHLMMYGAIIVVAMLYKPQGMMGSFEKWYWMLVDKLGGKSPNAG
ncbi:branched-chain amino acid ABC transporter permease [Desulfosarcina ovata]|uniref:Amino acid ABC transporter permease n=1 Tax=Desulfosarcina ovata subsp. ovata TaxID=2752305 RepID=A0A5K8A3N9_9BACT|nr:branched-chain amino acid ABC transporter permease [Desulfosarcina ovata]BBO87203.1 amino acid ABC transporter permease [Desulfosarcina ovata subsp. ovata]